MSDNNRSLFDELFDEADIVHVYTRAQAIEDGIQRRLEGDEAQLARETGWALPIFITAGVDDVLATAEDPFAALHDILFVAHFMARLVGADEDLISFFVRVAGKDYRLLAQCAAVDFDDPAPSVTFMTPSEY